MHQMQSSNKTPITTFIKRGSNAKESPR